MKKKFFAELCGTFVLTFIGVGVAIAASFDGATIGLVAIALGFGFAALMSIYVFGDISGSHINPAVTIALLFNKSVELSEAVYYILAQLAGATLASFALAFSFGGNSALNYGLTKLGDNITVQQGFFVEMLLTAFLVLTVLTLVKKSKSENGKVNLHDSLPIALSITMGILMGGMLTGGSLNPARSFGPAFVANSWDNFFLVYTLGPIAGAFIASLLFKFFNECENSKQKK